MAQSKDVLVISQRKYALDILEEIGMINAKPVDKPINSSVKLVPEQGESYSNLGRCKGLVSKLNYLNVTRPNIAFAVSVVSHFLNKLSLSRSLGCNQTNPKVY